MFFTECELEDLKQLIPKTHKLYLKLVSKPELSIPDCLDYIENQRKKNQNTLLKRHALYPILDEEMYSFYQKQENFGWSSSEIEYVADIRDYVESSPAVKRMVNTILAFFLSGDGAISNNILWRFMLECDTYEEQMFYISQAHIESIHADTYGQAAITFLRTKEEVSFLISAAEEIPCVKSKLSTMEKWTHSKLEKYKRYMAFACAEGIFFCSLFVPIFWFRPRGKFRSFVTANEFIRRDESLHKSFNIAICLREIKKILDVDPRQLASIHNDLIEILKEFVAIEDKFVDYILPEHIEDLNAKDMKSIVRIIADGILEDLGIDRIYNCVNPYSWADDFCYEEKTNFFELRVAAYKKRSIDEYLDWKSRTGYQMSIEEKSKGYTDTSGKW